MKQIYLLFLALTFAAVGYGQTFINEPLTSLPTGWSESGPVTFSANGASFGPANGSNPDRFLTSDVENVSSFSSVTLTFLARANANSTDIKIFTNIDNAGFTLHATISSIDNSPTIFSTHSTTITTTAASTLAIRFVKDGGNNTIIVKDVVATGCPTNGNPQAFTVSAVSSSQIDLGYTANLANNNTIIVFDTTDTFSTPTGTPPAEGSTFAGGTLLFNGPGNDTYNHTGLIPNTTYYYRAYSYNGCSYSSGLSAQATTTTSCVPSNQATNFSASNINTPTVGNATLNWSRGSGNNVLVVMRQGSAVSSNPVNGTSYTANTAFGTGQQIGTGNYVMYNGPANTVNVTGLNASTTYHVSIYEYNSTGNCYNTPALTGNFNVPGSVNYLFFSDTWFPEDPNGIATAVDNISVFLGNAIINSNTTINNINVSSSGALTVNSGIVLQVNGSLNMDSDNLNYSSLMADGTIIGTIRYDRHVNGGPGVGVGGGANDLISSPLVSSQNFGDFAASNGNIKFDTRTVENGGDPNNKVFGPFDKSTGTYVTWNSVNEANNAIVSGVGYRAASTDNLGFTFTGSVNQGIVTNNIVYTTTPGVPFKPWNLIGNPYPAYINVADFLNYVVDANGTKNLDILALFGAAVYGYDGDGNDGWTIWNLNTPEKNIAPGQGFLIQADETQVAAYDLKFAPSMRVIGNTDDFIPNRSANTDNLHLKLRANIGTGNYHTDFYFNENSSSGLDRGYDAVVYGSVAAAKSIYSHLVENNTGIDYAVQSLASEALGSDIIIPLGIKATQGQQVTVSIAESDLPSNIEVILEDNVTGTFTMLNYSDYIFTPSATLNSTGRFFLRFSNQTLSTPDNSINGLQIFTTAAPRALLVKGQLANTTSITLYDVQGRVVLSSQLEASTNSNQVDVSNLSSGLYVVKLNNSSQEKTQKVILK